MTKGADSVMIPRMLVDEDRLEQMKRNITKFATDGLRTLVVAEKYVDEKTATEFIDSYENIKVDASQHSC